MWDFIGPELVTVGPWGLTILVVATVLASVIRGWLVPRASVDRMERQFQERLEEAKDREGEWRSLFQVADTRADTAAAQVSTLLPSLQTMERALQAIPEAAQQVRGRGRT